MVKLLICIFCGLLLAVVMLQLRQQHLELSHQCNQVHTQIESQQAKLWNQQLQIAVYTAPNAIQKTVGQQQLKLVPRSPLPAGKSNWIDAKGDPGATD